MRKLTDLFSLTAILSVPVLLALTLPMIATQPANAADEPAGKAVFMAQKCNMCHNVPSAGIERTTKSDKVAGPDLPGDNKGKPASFFSDFLQQKVENQEGHKHKKEWKGTADELKQLTEWIASQK